MAIRDAHRQAAALRIVAERVERGEVISAELADALANDLAHHPDELAAVEAHEGSLPQWMADELDRRDRDGTDSEDGDVVMGRLLAKHSQRRRSA
jgi:hypothetical protein